MSGTKSWNVPSYPDAGPVLPAPCGLPFCPKPVLPLRTFLEPRPQGQPEQVRPPVCSPCDWASSLSRIPSSSAQVAQIKGSKPLWIYEWRGMRKGGMRVIRGTCLPTLPLAPPPQLGLCSGQAPVSVSGSRDDRGERNLTVAPGPVPRKLACGGGARSGRKKGKILEAPWTWPRLSPTPLCPLAALHSQGLPGPQSPVC